MAGKFLIGVDTGGTYTDAAVLAEGGREVLARAKALTTRGDLAIGVTEAISGAITALPETISPSDINLVSVSTTLATNAVVEGHGNPVAAILIGFDDQMTDRAGVASAFPGIPVIRIAGGHDHNGDVVQQLDAEMLEAELARVGGGVDAFAVASRFAVRNPAHEEAAREIIYRAAGKPVTLSSELSSALDAPRRALTAVLNARLISRISMLIDAVRRAMEEHGIDAPLMIVKGDGSLALAETVALRPIETILSGPAASLVGAACLTGLEDFLLSDMGGTTTDLGFLVGGRPVVSETGAVVGGWRTMVKAIDARTIGLGGDSEVALDYQGNLTLGPRRVVPVSLLAARYAGIEAILEAELADGPQSMQGRFVLLPMGGDKAGAAADRLNPREADLLAKVSDVPQAVSRLAPMSAQQRTLRTLQNKGLVQVGGFTPSDASHVLGLQSNWSAPAARLCARVMARQRDDLQAGDDAALAFCRDVWDRAVSLSGRAILNTALGRDLDGAPNELVNAVCEGRGRHGRAKIVISPEMPIVAVGGPVEVYYGEVGKRLHTEIVFSDYCDVANAVGAASGVVSTSVSIEVNGDGGGGFRVLGVDDAEMFASAVAAIERARTKASEAARAAVLDMGAFEPELSVSVERQMLPDAVDDNGLLSALVTVEAVGRPQL